MPAMEIEDEPGVPIDDDPSIMLEEIDPDSYYNDTSTQPLGDAEVQTSADLKIVSWPPMLPLPEKWSRIPYDYDSNNASETYIYVIDRGVNAEHPVSCLQSMADLELTYTRTSCHAQTIEGQESHFGYSHAQIVPIVDTSSPDLRSTLTIMGMGPVLPPKPWVTDLAWQGRPTLCPSSSRPTTTHPM